MEGKRKTIEANIEYTFFFCWVYDTFQCDKGCNDKINWFMR